MGGEEGGGLSKEGQGGGVPLIAWDRGVPPQSRWGGYPPSPFHPGRQKTASAVGRSMGRVGSAVVRQER